MAAQNGHVHVVLDLIHHVGIEGCGGATGGIDALCLASAREHVGVMAVLTDVGVVDKGQALCRAAMFGREGSVKFPLSLLGRATRRPLIIIAALCPWAVVASMRARRE